MMRRFRIRTLLSASVALAALAALWFGPVSLGQVTTGSLPSDVQDLIDQFTTTGTTTTGTPTTEPSEPTAPTEGGRSPITTGLNNVTLGSLQDRAPGRMTQQAIAVHTGQQEITGDADDFKEPSFVRETLFGLIQAALQAIEQGFGQALGLGGLFGGNLFGPGAINVGAPLDNQTTTGTGDIVLLP